jgi:hypothetical protein
MVRIHTLLKTKQKQFLYDLRIEISIEQHDVFSALSVFQSPIESKAIKIRKENRKIVINLEFLYIKLSRFVENMAISFTF